MNSLSVQVFALLVCIVIWCYIKIRFVSDVDKRLQASRTHKEFRNIYRELQEKSLTDKAELLNKKELPEILIIIRKLTPHISIIGILSGIFRIISKSKILVYVSPACAALLFIAAAVYRITEAVNARKVIPELSKSKNERFHSKSPKNKKKPSAYTSRDIPIIIMAYINRYGFILVGYILIILAEENIIPHHWIGISFILYGLVEWIISETGSESFYCAMQNINHQKMTPYRHSASFKNKAKKEGRQLSLVFIIIGIVLLLISFLE